MPVTANTMIKRAMRLVQVIGVDVNPTAQEADDALYALNAMLEAWSIERLMVYQIQQTTHSWTADQTSRTIGSAGNFNVARPIRIESKGNFFRDSSNNDYQLTTLPRENYEHIVSKGAKSTIPEYLFHDDGFPTRTLYAYPVPSQTLTLHLNHWTPLQSFSALTTAISMPPGYQAAVEFNLGVWIAPEYGAAAVKAAKNIEKQAATLKSAIRSLNRPNLVASVDMGLGGRAYNINVE